MPARHAFLPLVVAVLLAVCTSPAAAQTPQGPGFTYQGRLTAGGAPAEGAYDFQFLLYDAAVGGSQVGPILVRDDVAVAGGLFTVTLDFGSVFSGTRRWLDVGVRPGASSGAFTPLGPRAELTSAPNASYASKAGDASTLGGVAAGSYFQLASILPITSGGTAGSSPAGARANLQAAQSGANSDITSLAGLTTPLSVAQGGTGAASIGASPFLTKTIGACPPGTSIQTINPDGTVVCQADNEQRGFVLSTLDTAGLVGNRGVVTMGADGLGLIAYYDNTNFDLKVAHCVNTACTSATLSTLDSPGGVGSEASVAIGPDGLGLISYSGGAGGLKVAHCLSVACTTATLSTVDASGFTLYTSVAIGADGLGLISYYDNTNLDLKVAHCANAACTSASLATLDGAADVGRFTSVAIGADGLGLISYCDDTNQDLKVVHCSNVACSAATGATLDSAGNVGPFTSVAVGADGLGLISYRDGSLHLKVAHCNNALCTGATLSVLDLASVTYSTVTIGADGLGLIAYYDQGNGDLKAAHCVNTTCTAATLSTVDSAGDVGQYASVTIGADGLGLITYFDNVTFDLKVAHCANLTCNPFVRRR